MLGLFFWFLFVLGGGVLLVFGVVVFFLSIWPDMAGVERCCRTVSIGQKRYGKAKKSRCQAIDSYSSEDAELRNYLCKPFTSLSALGSVRCRDWAVSVARKMPCQWLGP